MPPRARSPETPRSNGRSSNLRAIGSQALSRMLHRGQSRKSARSSPSRGIPKCSPLIALGKYRLPFRLRPPGICRGGSRGRNPPVGSGSSATCDGLGATSITCFWRSGGFSLSPYHSVPHTGFFTQNPRFKKRWFLRRPASNARAMDGSKSRAMALSQAMFRPPRNCAVIPWIPHPGRSAERRRASRPATTTCVSAGSR